METYDFDTLVDRRGTNSYKWDSAADSDEGVKVVSFHLCVLVRLRL